MICLHQFANTAWFQKNANLRCDVNLAPSVGCVAQDDEDVGNEEVTPPTAEDDIGASREGSRTDAEAVQR